MTPDKVSCRGVMSLGKNPEKLMELVVKHFLDFVADLRARMEELIQEFQAFTTATLRNWKYAVKG